jgi:hypothetical protein
MANNDSKGWWPPPPDYPRQNEQEAIARARWAEIQKRLAEEAAKRDDAAKKAQAQAEKEIREHKLFLELIAEALRPVIRRELQDMARTIHDGFAMATKSIGRVDSKALAKGKIKVKPAHMSVPKKAAAKAKADRTETRLRANRKGKT